MWRKVAIAGAVAAGIVGAGTAALAATGGASGSTNGPAPAGGTAHQRHGMPMLRAAAKNFEHGSFVENHDGANVTHDAIQGRVQGTPGSTITVKATDGTTWSFAVDASTKVYERENGAGNGRGNLHGKGKPGAIGDVKPNDHVVVVGTDTAGARTADRIVDLGSA